MLRQVTAIRYVTPLREGGSLPGVVEADDLGTYVVKFRGAGQGPKALDAEVVAGELARRLGLPVPELVVVGLDPVVARAEPDEEVQELVTSSAGLNLGIDFLPGAVGYDRTFAVPREEASRVLWLDGFVANVDRSARNTNLLVWHKRLWAIDHGACLRFHHSWGFPETFANAAYRFSDHVLDGRGDPRTVHAELAGLVTSEALEMIMNHVPDEWLEPDPKRPDPQAPVDAAQARTAYGDYLLARLAAADRWLP